MTRNLWHIFKTNKMMTIEQNVSIYRCLLMLLSSSFYFNSYPVRSLHISIISLFSANRFEVSSELFQIFYQQLIWLEIKRNSFFLQKKNFRIWVLSNVFANMKSWTANNLYAYSSAMYRDLFIFSVCAYVKPFFPYFWFFG